MNDDKGYDPETEGFGGTMQRVTNKKTLLVPTIRSISYEQSKASKEEGLGEHDPDVINVIFDVVYEGVNDNGDRFTEAALRGAFHTMKNKPINWEHDEPNIGVITDSWLVEATAAEPLHMSARGTIWAWEYPEYADLLIASAQLGQMGFAETAQYGPSMEVYFQDADYIVGDYERVVPMSQDTENLGARLGGLYGGKAVSRELKDIFFSGVGMTATPAEKKVKFLAVATNRSRMNGTEIFKGLEDTEFALPALRMFPIDKKEHVAASIEYFDKVVATLRDTNPAQVVEAHERLKQAAEAFELHMPEIINLSTVSQSASDDRNCMGEMHDDCLDNETVKEEREEIMAKEETKVVAEEVTPEEEPAVEETEVTEEVTEDAVEETEASSEESFNLESAFMELRDMLNKLMPAEETAEAAEASEDTEEADEVTALKARITELETALTTATETANTAKAGLVGFKRLVELEKAGITVDDSSKEARIQSLASMTDETWKTYITDVKTATVHDDSAELSTASLILGDDEDEEAPKDELTIYRQKTRAFWQRG